MKIAFYFFTLAAIAVSIQSCRNTSEITSVEDGDMIKADISEGKVIYTRDCARCHEQKKVEDYTAAQWENILARMVIKAKLDDTQSRQVKAYVEWELEND